MRWVFLVIIMFVFLPQAAFAQVDNSKLDIVQEPICFALKNEASYSVNGGIQTAKFTRPDGVISRHRSNFRLKAAGEIDPKTGEPADRVEFCSYGPFLPDRQLILTIRTLFPVFECKTRVDTLQEIVIKGQRRADDNGVMTWVECFKPDGSKMGKPEE